MNNLSHLKKFDPEIHSALCSEEHRQEQHIELIASENYASEQVMEAQGSVLTNKYAEGYPGKRYYGGCLHVDEVEELAIQRIKTLFSADYANVQPHSGSQANAAVYQAVCKPGDVVLGMDLTHGGHLTHGAKVNFSGSIYKSVQYGVDKNGLLDFDAIRSLAIANRPKMIVAGFSAYSRKVDWSKFREIADEVGAIFMADIAHVAGLIVTGLYPNPVPYADIVTSTTHKTLRGPRGGFIVSKTNPTLEKAINSKVFPGMQGGPLMHVIAAKAVAFKEAMQPDFKHYQQRVIDNANIMANTLMDRGYEVISGGTDNHMFLLSFVKQNLTGKAIDHWLSEANITVNKNTVPNDPQSPFVTSGIRLGTPAVTTRGFGLEDCKLLANSIADIVDAEGDENVIHSVREKMKNLCESHPVYPQR